MNDHPPVLPQSLGALIKRLQQSAVAWSWVYTGFRLAAGLILLPLVLRILPTADLGMYYVLLSLSALVPLVDFGFGPTVGRFVAYAMGGAESIQAQGIARPGASTTPNYRLLWELLFTTRRLYRYLAVALLVVLGAWGSYVVELRITETSSVEVTRIAWWATLATALFDIYANWWVVFLRSMNQVVQAARISVLGTTVRLVIAAALLLAGGGLLSLPVGSFFGSLLQRHLARKLSYRLLSAHPPPASVDVRKYLAVFWPNSWRLGIQLFSGYLTVNANTAICLHVLGLQANAQYGLSAQLLAFVTGMAAVWTGVKWPLIGQLRARHDLGAVRRILWPRLWLQFATYAAGCAAIVVLTPLVLHWIGGGKQTLSPGWYGLMMLNGLLEAQFIVWGTLLFTENRLPYLWPTVATNVMSLVFSLAFVHYTGLGIGGLVLGPLIAGVIFNYWYWPFYSARSLGTRLVPFMFKGPEAAAAAAAPKTVPA